MDKANQLLEQAWHEAAKQGIALSSVDYEVIDRMDGSRAYVHHSVSGVSMPSTEGRDADATGY